MLFKGVYYLELLWPFCSAEQNHLCNFGRGYYEEQFCEIGPVVQEEMSFEDISYLELWRPFVQWKGTIFAILVESIMRNNSVNLF